MKLNAPLISLSLLVARVRRAGRRLGANWPQCARPAVQRREHRPQENLPVEWDTEKNVVWKTALPSWSAGHPYYLGRYDLRHLARRGVQLTRKATGGPEEAPARKGAASAAGRSGPRPAAGGGKTAIFLLAVNRADGAIKWRRIIGGNNRIYRQANLSSPSPVTDGRYVWTMTGSGTALLLRLQRRKVLGAQHPRGVRRLRPQPRPMHRRRCCTAAGFISRSCTA